ncbi:hypothetical protein FRB90_005929 [Tulasnella sp. 427]|nr:hypothetical protein FRB90_005929 [Tulasnella sp. 427]
MSSTLKSRFQARLSNKNEYHQAGLDSLAALDQSDDEDQEEGELWSTPGLELPAPFVSGEMPTQRTNGMAQPQRSAAPDMTSGTPIPSREVPQLGSEETLSGTLKRLEGAPNTSAVSDSLNLVPPSPMPVDPGPLPPIPRLGSLPSDGINGTAEPDRGSQHRTVQHSTGSSQVPAPHIPPDHGQSTTGLAHSENLASSSYGSQPAVVPGESRASGLSAGPPKTDRVAPADLLSSGDPAPMPGSSRPGAQVDRSTAPSKGSPSATSYLQAMLNAGIPPSDEMRLVLGRAVDRMLPNGETRGSIRATWLKSNEGDEDVSRVLSIVERAYVQIADSGLGQPQETVATLSILDPANRSRVIRELPAEGSPSVGTHSDSSRKLKSRPPDSSEQPSPTPNLSSASTASFPGSRDVSRASPKPPPTLKARSINEQPNDINRKRDDPVPSVIRTSESGDLGLHDHSNRCGDRVNGSRDLGKVGAGSQVAVSHLSTSQQAPQAPPTTATTKRVRLKLSNLPETPVLPSVAPENAFPARPPSVDIAIARLNESLAALDSDIERIRNRHNANGRSTTAHVKDQADTTTILNFLGPAPLSNARYTFKVSRSEAEAASRWSKRTDSFDPQGDYLEYTLTVDSRSGDREPSRTSLHESMVVIRLDGESIITPSRKVYSITSRIVPGINILEIFALADASEQSFRLERRGPSKDEMLEQTRQAEIWKTLA